MIRKLESPATKIRNRLEEARSHLEAADVDPGRVGLAYAQVLHALGELRELGPDLEAPAPTPFVTPEQREEIRLACKRAEERLRASRERRRLAVESLVGVDVERASEVEAP